MHSFTIVAYIAGWQHKRPISLNLWEVHVAAQNAFQYWQGNLQMISQMKSMSMSAQTEACVWRDKVCGGEG